MPARVALHDTVAVPEPVMLPGVIAPHVKPEGIVSVTLTTPVKPFRADIVIVEEAETPALTAAGEAAVMVKSWTWKSAVAEWTTDALVPVTVSV